MPFSDNIKNREFDKFLNVNGETGVRVATQDVFGAPLSSDSFTVEYPTATREIYKFRQGGITGTVLKTITINYTDASKTEILNGAIS